MKKIINKYFQFWKEKIINAPWYKKGTKTFEHFRKVMGVRLVAFLIFLVIVVLFDMHTNAKTSIPITETATTIGISRMAYSIFFVLLGTYAFFGRIFIFFFRPISYLVESLLEDLMGGPMYMQGGGRDIVPRRPGQTPPGSPGRDLFGEVFGNRSRSPSPRNLPGSIPGATPDPSDVATTSTNRNTLPTQDSIPPYSIVSRDVLQAYNPEYVNNYDRVNNLPENNAAISETIINNYVRSSFNIIADFSSEPLNDPNAPANLSHLIRLQVIHDSFLHPNEKIQTLIKKEYSTYKCIQPGYTSPFPALDGNEYTVIEDEAVILMEYSRDFQHIHNKVVLIHERMRQNVPSLDSFFGMEETFQGIIYFCREYRTHPFLLLDPKYPLDLDQVATYCLQKHIQKYAIFFHDRTTGALSNGQGFGYHTSMHDYRSPDTPEHKAMEKAFVQRFVDEVNRVKREVPITFKEVEKGIVYWILNQKVHPAPILHGKEPVEDFIPDIVESILLNRNKPHPIPAIYGTSSSASSS